MAVEQIKSVRDTFLYSVTNKSGEMDRIISTLMSKGIVVDKNMLNAQYTTINNYFKFPLKIDILNAVESGIIIPMMYPKGITANNRIPTSLPFIMKKSPQGIVQGVAIIDNFASFDDDIKNRVTIDANKLYCLLESAYIARGIQMSFNSIRKNVNMYTHGTSIYAHMFIRVLNKEYALNVDKTAYNKVLFLAAKFFMLNVLQLQDSELVYNYALKAAGNISPIAIKRLNDAFPKDAYKDISEFVKAISMCGYMIINGLDKLNIRDYVAKYIQEFGNSSLFALEHLSYFVFAIISTVNRAHIAKVYGWEAAMGNSGEKLYGYIANACHRS